MIIGQRWRRVKRIVDQLATKNDPLCLEIEIVTAGLGLGIGEKFGIAAVAEQKMIHADHLVNRVVQAGSDAKHQQGMKGKVLVADDGKFTGMEGSSISVLYL